MNNLQKNILSALDSAENFLSGEELANRFSVSRVAICKAIHSLQEEGHNIVTRHAKGYQLLPSDKYFDEGVKVSFPCKVYTFDEIDSTSIHAKQKMTDTPVLVLASTQTAGKGRRESHFPSPTTGTYFTLGIPVRFPIEKLSSYNCSILSIVSTFFHTNLNEHSLEIDGKKVGGVLIESNVEYDECTSILIGVGYYPPIKDKLKSVSALANQLYSLFH